MTHENVIFAGSGCKCPSLMMWSNVNQISMPLMISQFPQYYSVYAVTVSPTGNHVAAGTKAGLLRVHPMPNGQAPEEKHPVLFDVFHRPGIDSLAFCSDDILASGGRDGIIKLWSVTDRQQLSEICAHQGEVSALCRITPQLLASIGGDGILRIWDINSHEKQYESNPFDISRIRALTSLDYHPETGLLLHPSRSGNLHVYDVHNEFKARLLPAHQGNFNAIAYGADYVVTAGLDDSEIKIWDFALDTMTSKASASAGILSVGWAGTKTILTIYSDGSGQFWNVDNGHLLPGPRTTDLDLRTVTGLPSAIMANRQTSESLRWRDQKLAQARELIDQPEKHYELMSIVNELHQHGFSIEGLLVQADTAKSQGKLLWELECRLLLAEELGSRQAALPSLFALAELLEAIKEPRATLHYLERILQIDPNSTGAKEQIDSLQSDPFMHLCPETDVRGDLMQMDRVVQELEKYTILNKKFIWRFAVSIGQKELLDPDQYTQEFTNLKIEDLATAILESKTKHHSNTAHSELSRVKLFGNGQLRDIMWIYIPGSIKIPGIAFAIEIDLTSEQVEFVPYNIFDPMLLNIPASVSAKEHNQQVEKGYQTLIKTDIAEDWWDSIHELVIKSSKEYIKEFLAAQDDDF